MVGFAEKHGQQSDTASSIAEALASGRSAKQFDIVARRATGEVVDETRTPLRRHKRVARAARARCRARREARTAAAALEAKGDVTKAFFVAEKENLARLAVDHQADRCLKEKVRQNSVAKESEAFLEYRLYSQALNDAKEAAKGCLLYTSDAADE